MDSNEIGQPFGIFLEKRGDGKWFMILLCEKKLDSSNFSSLVQKQRAMGNVVNR